MDDTGVIYGAGFAGENFSVEREKKNLLEQGKINKNFFVLLTDNANRRFGKKDKIIHHSFCIREPLAKELYEWLILMKLQNLDIKNEPKKPLIHVYILEKG